MIGFLLFAASLKLMSFNVCHCSGMDGRIDLGRTAACISAERPDVACLQELDNGAERSAGVDQPAELGRLTGLYATFGKAIPLQGGAYGVAILSREKPLLTTTFPLPGKEPRVLLVCEFTNCVVATTHLSVAAENERIESIALIRRALEPFVVRKPVFLTGDWNALPESAVVKGLEGFLTVLSGTACQTYHGKPQFGPDGQPLDMSKFCIDYVACDRAHADKVKVTETYVVEDRKTSDHAPLVVSLTLPEPGREAVMFIGAHPDDSEGFAATAFLLREKYDIHVVDLTRGERGMGPKGLLDGSTGRIRVAEEEAACRLLGATPHFLCETNGSCRASARASEELAALLRTIRPKAVFCHWPVDTHSDHVQCAAVLSAALGEILSREGFRTQRYFYEVLLRQTQNWHPLYSVDVTRTMDLKSAMMRKYACQNKEDKIVKEKLEQAELRGRERRPSCRYAETFTTFDGRPIEGGVLEELPETAKVQR